MTIEEVSHPTKQKRPQAHLWAQPKHLLSTFDWRSMNKNVASVGLSQPIMATPTDGHGAGTTKFNPISHHHRQHHHNHHRLNLRLPQMRNSYFVQALSQTTMSFCQVNGDDKISILINKHENLKTFVSFLGDHVARDEIRGTGHTRARLNVQQSATYPKTYKPHYLVDGCYCGRRVCMRSDGPSVGPFSDDADHHNGGDEQLSYLECSLSGRDHLQHQQGVRAGSAEYHG